MLFSHPNTAALINGESEPVWESVRPVPSLTVDFGNGQVVRRTLHGNIATWITDSRGRVVDVIPGIYERTVYERRLRLLLAFARRLGTHSDESFEEQILAHHKDALVTPPLVVSGLGDITKRRLEHPTEELLAHGKRLSAEFPENDQAERLGAALILDTVQNESERRQLIHRHLAEAGVTQVDLQTRWLYAHVLHTDLDDPWLGLGPALFGADPFNDRGFHLKNR